MITDYRGDRILDFLGIESENCVNWYRFVVGLRRLPSFNFIQLAHETEDRIRHILCSVVVGNGLWT